MNGAIVNKILELKPVYDVNIIFLPIKFVDLLGIRIVLRLKKYTDSVYPVKDSHMKYTFHPDKGTSSVKQNDLIPT